MRARVLVLAIILGPWIGGGLSTGAVPAGGGFPLTITAGGRSWTRTRGDVGLTGSMPVVSLEYASAVEAMSANPTTTRAGYETSVPRGPWVTLQVNYARAGGRRETRKKAVAGLERTFDYSEWIEEDDPMSMVQQQAPERSAPRIKYILATKGDAEYRVIPVDCNPVPLLAALVSGDTELFVLSVQYVSECSVEQHGVERVGPLGAPDLWRLREGIAVYPVAMPFSGGAPLTLAFQLKTDRYGFGVAGVVREPRGKLKDSWVSLAGPSGMSEAAPDREGKVKLKLSHPADRHDVIASPGPSLSTINERATNVGCRVHLQRGASVPAAAKVPEPPRSGAWAEVAAALAAVLEAGHDGATGQFTSEREGGKIVSRGPLPAELAALLMASPEPADESRRWKTSAFWSDELKRPFSRLTRRRAEGAKPGEIGAEAGLPELALLLGAATGDSFWFDVARAGLPEREAGAELPAGTWGLPQATAALRALALGGKTAAGPVKALAESIARSPDPCDYFRDKASLEAVCASGHPDARGMAALALSRAGDEAGARVQSSALLERHVGRWVGYAKLAAADYPNRNSGTPWTAYRSQALAVQAWLEIASRGGPDETKLRDAAARIRAAVVDNGWDRVRGGFVPLSIGLGSGKAQPALEPGRFVLSDQFWALAIFAPECFPYGRSNRGEK